MSKGQSEGSEAVLLLGMTLKHCPLVAAVRTVQNALRRFNFLILAPVRGMRRPGSDVLAASHSRASQALHSELALISSKCAMQQAERHKNFRWTS